MYNNLSSRQLFIDLEKNQVSIQPMSQLEIDKDYTMFFWAFDSLYRV